jgi:hypothetical protein
LERVVALAAVSADCVLALIVTVTPALAAGGTHCADSHIGTGRARVRAHSALTKGMTCKTVHHLLGESYLWRTGGIASGMTSSGTPVR